jgi:pimeloyl-ACP methyl ester carboxylesterase
MTLLRNFMFCFSLLLLSCRQEEISKGDNISDLFYLENQGAHMPVLVEGNINSGVILIFLHGGPGGTGIGFNNDENMNQYIESQFAVAYHDQRSAGNSQGSTATKLTVEQYVDDLKKLIPVLRKRYSDTTKIFLMSHSWGGMIAAAFLTDNNNQELISGWINMAGSHNYQLNDELTRAYLQSYGKDQIQKNIHVAEWQPIVDFADNNVPNYNYTISKQYNSYGSTVESYIDDINNGGGFGSPLGLLTLNQKALTPLWFISNSGGTYLLNLPKDLLNASYSDKLGNITKPVINIYGKYDFTVPKG